MESPTSGVKPMAIAGRMVLDRERLIGMTDEERSWRKQWVKDQQLDICEPYYVPELEKELMNPIRRMYRGPLDKLFVKLEPSMGIDNARVARFWTGKFLLIATAIYSGFYYFKYNQNNWTTKSGWRVISSRKVCNPGDPEFPKISDRNEPSDYADRGYRDSALYKEDVEEIPVEQEEDANEIPS